MKASGPEETPPPESDSREERKGDTLTPAPDPYLKIIPSFRIHSKIDSIESSTFKIKQAEHWGCSFTPTLNQTGLLKEAIWYKSIWRNSSAKVSDSRLFFKCPNFSPQVWITTTTRSIIWRRAFSRTGVPTLPRKYLVETI